MDLLEVTDKLVQQTIDLLNMHGGQSGCKCETCYTLRQKVGSLVGTAKTFVTIEKNKLDHEFAVQMGMEEEGWVPNYLTGSRFGL